MSQVQSDEDFEITSENERSPRLTHISSFKKKVANPSSKGLSLQSLRADKNSRGRKPKRRASASHTGSEPNDGDDPRVSATPSPRLGNHAMPKYLLTAAPELRTESNLLGLTLNISASPQEEAHSMPLTVSSSQSIPADSFPSQTPQLEITSQEQAASQPDGQEMPRYSLRETNPSAQKPFTNLNWLNWRTDVPEDADVSFLNEPVEGYDLAIHSSSSEDGDFVPDEPASPKSQPLIHVNEYTTSESEPLSPAAKRRKGALLASSHEPSQRSPKRRMRSRKRRPSDRTGQRDAPEPHSSSHSNSPPPVFHRRRANHIIVSDSDESKQPPARTKQSKKINFLTYFNSHIAPAFPSRESIPLFLRICQRRYQLRAQDPNARLVDYPWAKCIYFVSAKANTSQRLLFRLSKALRPRKPPSHSPKAVRGPPPKPRVPRRRIANRRAMLFNPRKKQDLLDFYHKLDMEDQRLYQRRHVDPDSFFYRFNEPGFSTNAGPHWVPKETDWFQATLHTYKTQGWPLGTRHPRIQPAKGWGLFSLGVPTRTGQQCEEYYRDLVAKDPGLVLPSRPITQRYRKHVSRKAREVWSDPTVRKYVHGIPRRRPRQAAAPRTRASRITDYFDQPEASPANSTSHEHDMGGRPNSSISPTNVPAGSDILRLQKVTEMLVPHLSGGVYFDSKTYVGSGLLFGVVQLASKSGDVPERHHRDSLPTLKVAGFLIDLRKEFDSMSGWIEGWGRWLLKKINSLDLHSSGVLKDEVESVFEAYRLLLPFGGEMAGLITEQLIIIESFLSAIHCQLLAQLFGPLGDIIGIHIWILDCLARCHLLSPDPNSQLHCCLVRFCEVMVRYAMAFAQDCEQLPLNHPVKEGLQVSRVMFAAMRQPSLDTFPADSFDGFWKAVNRALLASVGRDAENIWKGLSVILHSTAPDLGGVFPCIPPRPSQVSPNWELFNQVLAWATHAESAPVSNPTLLESDSVNPLSSLPRPKSEPQYIRELLIRVVVATHYWHWPLTQKVLGKFYSCLKVSCGLLAADASGFPEFLLSYCGTIPSLADVVSSPTSYTSFEIFLLLVARYIEQVADAATESRLARNDIEKFLSISFPIHKLSFAQDSLQENSSCLVNLISVFLVVAHALPLAVKTIDKQMRTFLLRLKQLSDPWDELPFPVLSRIVQGFFIALHVAVVRTRGLPEAPSAPISSQEVLDTIASIVKAAEGTPDLAIQFRISMQELIGNLLPLSGPWPITLDSLSLFYDTTRFFDTVNPYSTSYSIQTIAIEILDTFLGRIACLLAPLPQWLDIEDDFDSDDFDDEVFELLAQQTAISVPGVKPKTVSIIHKVAEFFYGKKTHLRLMAILCNYLNTMNTSNTSLTPFLAMRSCLLISRICNICKLSVLDELWKAVSFVEITQFTHSPAHRTHRMLLIDRSWMMIAFLDSDSWDTSCMESAVLLWAQVISDPVTRRHELLTQCLAWAARSTPRVHLGALLFCGDVWRKFPTLEDKKKLLVSEPGFFDLPSTELMNFRRALISEIVAIMGSKVETCPQQDKAALVSLCHSFLITMLSGLRYNITEDLNRSHLPPELSDCTCTIVDSVFKSLPWLVQHGPVSDLTEALLPLSAGGMPWKHLSYNSLHLRVQQLQCLDIAGDANLQQLLWSWYRNLVLQDLEFPYPLPSGAPLEKVADLFLPVLTVHMAWNRPQSGLRGYLYGAVISPILLSPFGSWHFATLQFLLIMLNETLRELSACVSRPDLFRLVCSPVQTELDILVYCLHHLSLKDPQIWLTAAGFDSYFSILSTLAQISLLIKRGNRDFFESNFAWFEKIQLVISTTLANLHVFWLRLIKENGPLNMTIPSASYNMLFSQAAHSEEFSDVDPSWEAYCQDAQAILDDSQERFLASVPPVSTSIVPNQQPRASSDLCLGRSIDQLVEVSTQLLQMVLPLWWSASHLSASLGFMVWRFFAESSQHPNQLPHFFTILARVLELLPTVGGPKAQLQDVLLNMGPRRATLMNWYRLSLKSLPPSLRPNNGGLAYASHARSASILYASPIL